MVGADTDQGTLHDTVTSVSTGTHHHHPAIDFQYHGTVDSGVDRSGRYQTLVFKQSCSGSVVMIGYADNMINN